jgi:hypothetical protein
MNQPVLFTGERIHVAVPQKPYIPFGLEIVQILRERPELALEELDGMSVLHAPIDGHLLPHALGLESHARKFHVHTDGDPGSQHKHQQQGEARLLGGIRAISDTTRFHPATSASSGSVC